MEHVAPVKTHNTDCPLLGATEDIKTIYPIAFLSAYSYLLSETI